MKEKSFQEHYIEFYSHCYGCGTRNSEGHQIKSYWDNDESVAHFQPKDYHIAIPGYVYGGLLASIIDCHGTGTASAAAYREEGRPMGSEPTCRYVTASLHVDYLLPTPLGPELELRGQVVEIKGKKTIVDIQVYAEGKITAKGRVIAIRILDYLIA
jgi:acyl-coenzyme A thioesterase PaaI-like protein